MTEKVCYKKPVEVKAIQWTGNNWYEIRKFGKDNKNDIKKASFDKIKMEDKILYSIGGFFGFKSKIDINSYFVIEEQKIFILSQEEFEKQYTLKKPQENSFNSL